MRLPLPRRRRGSALVMAVILTVMVATLSIVALDLARTDVLLSQSGADGAEARAVAVAGADRIIGLLKNGRMDLSEALSGAPDPTPYVADGPADATWASATIDRSGTGIAMGSTTLDDGTTASRLFNYRLQYPRAPDPNRGYIGPGDLKGWVVGRVVVIVNGVATDVATHKIDFVLKQELDALKAPLVLGGGGIMTSNTESRVFGNDRLNLDARVHPLDYHPVAQPLTGGEAVGKHQQFAEPVVATSVQGVTVLSGYNEATQVFPTTTPPAPLSNAAERSLPVQTWVNRLISGPPVPVTDRADADLDADEQPWGTTQAPSIFRCTGALRVDGAASGNPDQRLRGSGILLIRGGPSQPAELAINNDPAAKQDLLGHAPIVVSGGYTSTPLGVTGILTQDSGATVVDGQIAELKETGDYYPVSLKDLSHPTVVLVQDSGVAGRPDIDFFARFDFDLTKEKLVGADLVDILSFRSKFYITGQGGGAAPTPDPADLVRIVEARVEILNRDTGVGVWEDLDLGGSTDFLDTTAYSLDSAPGAWENSANAILWDDAADLRPALTATRDSFSNGLTDENHRLSIRVRVKVKPIYTSAAMGGWGSDVNLIFDTATLDITYKHRALDWEGLIVIAGGSSRFDTSEHQVGPCRLLGALMMADRYSASTGWAAARVDQFKIGKGGGSNRPPTELRYCPDALGQSVAAADPFRKIYPHARISLIDWRESPGGTAGP